MPIWFQIVRHDHRSKATWEGIQSDGRGLWQSEEAARVALERLIQKLTREGGPVAPRNFEIEQIFLKPTRCHRPPYGRYGRRVPWKIGVLESNGPVDLLKEMKAFQHPCWPKTIQNRISESA